MTMRRPLFGNGIPKNVLFADLAVPLFDTEALDPAQVYAVTLFCWSWKNLATPVLGTEPSLLMGVVSNGAPVVAVSSFFPEYFVAAKGQEPQGKPIVVLDRFMMRGEQQLYAQNLNAGSTHCWLYGYFEVAGESPKPEPFRPLQPTIPVDPFSCPPTLVFPVGPAASEYKTAHKLDVDYIDAVTLNVLAATIPLAPYAVVPTAFVRLPGGYKMPIPMPGVGETPGLTINCTPFEGIPMRSALASDSLIEIGFDNNGDVASGAALSGYGRFRRY